MQQTQTQRRTFAGLRVVQAGEGDPPPSITYWRMAFRLPPRLPTDDQRRSGEGGRHVNRNGGRDRALSDHTRHSRIEKPQLTVSMHLISD